MTTESGPETGTETEEAQIEQAIAGMVEVAMDWDNEKFASRTVGLLIHDEGNLNKYQRTLELVFAVHKRVLEQRARDLDL